ncbi:MAG: sugar phosphate isomerase/epimerase family protein [Desulfovibrio sp.]
MSLSQPNPSPLSPALFHVKLPHVRIGHGALRFFLERGLNPEICFDAHETEQLEPDDMRPIAEDLAGRGLTCTVHAPFLGLDFGSEDGCDRDLARMIMERTLRLVEVLRPRSVVVHGGPHRRLKAADFPAWCERALPLLEWTARTALDQGTEVMLENICHERPEQLAPLLEALDSKAGWCLDAGHMHVFSAVPPEDWVRRLGSRLGQLHLHDNDGSADQHRCVGQGCIDFARLFTVIMDCRPQPEAPVATLEVNYAKDVDASLAALGPVWPWNRD